MPHPPSTLPRAWLIVGLLWVVAALNYLDRMMITTMHDTLTAAIPMTESQYGWVTTIFLLVYAALSPLGGFIADRFNRSRLIIASLLVWSLFTWLTGHVKSYNQLIFVRGMMGVSEAAYLPAALALIADYHRGPTRSLATGIHMTGISIGSLIAGVGGWMAEHRGWSLAFDVFGVFGVVYTFVLLSVLRDPPRDELPATATPAQSQKPQFIAAIVDLFRTPAFIGLLVFWSLLGVVGWAFGGWMAVYLKETFHMTQSAAGFAALGYLYAGSLCGKVVGGVLADWKSRTHPRGRILVAAAGMFIAAPATLMIAHAGILALALAGLSLYGLTRSFSDANLMPILCQVSDPRYRATGYGVLNMFNMFAGGVTVYAGGAMRDSHFNLSILYQIAAAVLLVCGAVLLLVKPRARKEAPPVA
jgi:MFS family permease